MTLKDEALQIAKAAQKRQQDEEFERERKIEEESRAEGEKIAQSRILLLPDIIRGAAQQGKTSIYESCSTTDRVGSYKLGAIAQWARKNGFYTSLEFDKEAPNEGQENQDYLTISWGE